MFEPLVLRLMISKYKASQVSLQVDSYYEIALSKGATDKSPRAFKCNATDLRFLLQHDCVVSPDYNCRKAFRKCITCGSYKLWKTLICLTKPGLKTIVIRLPLMAKVHAKYLETNKLQSLGLKMGYAMAVAKTIWRINVVYVLGVGVKRGIMWERVQWHKGSCTPFPYIACVIA